MCSEAILCEEASAFARSLWLALVMASKVLFFTELPHRHNVVSSPTFPVFSQHGRGPGDWGGGTRTAGLVTCYCFVWHEPLHIAYEVVKDNEWIGKLSALIYTESTKHTKPVAGLQIITVALLRKCRHPTSKKKEHVVSLASDVKQNNTPQMACPVYRCVYVFGRYLSPGNVLASMIVSTAAAREGSAIDQEIRGLQFCRSKLPAILIFSLGGLSPGR